MRISICKVLVNFCIVLMSFSFRCATCKAFFLIDCDLFLSVTPAAVNGFSKWV